MYGRSSEPNQPVPMRYPHLLFALLCVLGLRTVSHAQLTLLNSFGCPWQHAIYSKSRAFCN